MSPLGSSTRTGIPASSASSRAMIPSPVFPEPVIPEDHAVRRQVGSLELELLPGGLTARNVDDVADPQVARLRFRHGEPFYFGRSAHRMRRDRPCAPSAGWARRRAAII